MGLNEPEVDTFPLPVTELARDKRPDEDAEEEDAKDATAADDDDEEEEDAADEDPEPRKESQNAT